MTTSTLTRPLPATLAVLRYELELMGVTAESPDHLDPEGELLAVLERQD